MTDWRASTAVKPARGVSSRDEQRAIVARRVASRHSRTFSEDGLREFSRLSINFGEHFAFKSHGGVLAMPHAISVPPPSWCGSLDGSVRQYPLDGWILSWSPPAQRREHISQEQYILYILSRGGYETDSKNSRKRWIDHCAKRTAINQQNGMTVITMIYILN